MAAEQRREVKRRDCGLKDVTENGRLVGNIRAETVKE